MELADLAYWFDRLDHARARIERGGDFEAHRPDAEAAPLERELLDSGSLEGFLETVLEPRAADDEVWRVRAGLGC